MDNLTAIVATEAKRAAEKVEGLETKLRAAMEAVKDHWLVTDENKLLQGAVGGAILTMSEDDRERTVKTWKSLQAISLAASGVPIAFDALDHDFEPVAILPLWDEVNGRGLEKAGK